MDSGSGSVPFILVAAGVTAGRGLKRQGPCRSDGRSSGGRRDSRPWIETQTVYCTLGYYPVAAGVTAGRGLKRRNRLRSPEGERVAAGVTAGRGLKRRGNRGSGRRGVWRPA